MDKIFYVKQWQLNNRNKVIGYKRKYKNKNIQIARQYVNSYKTNKGCQYCNEKRFETLDLHHIRNKKINISRMVSHGYKLSTIKKEIKKCIILCSNCHRKKHYTGNNVYNNQKSKYIINYKSNSRCKNCFERHLACLDFHHQNFENKICGIGAMIRNLKFSLQDLIIEINKCEILCANCHRYLTYYTKDQWLYKNYN